ncbi:MAG: GxxExxY protein [Aggregatilineales bacterium]
MTETELSRIIAEAAQHVQRAVGGPGMQAKDYQHALGSELRSRGLKTGMREVAPGTYNGVSIQTPVRIPLVVEDRVVVACYAEPRYAPRFEAEALAQLRLTGLKLALVINFGGRSIRDNIRRVLNNAG